MSNLSKSEQRLRKHRRVRRKVIGSPERPRLNVFRSAKHIYAQLVDDSVARTIVAASSKTKDLELGARDKKAVATAVGQLLAQKAQEKGISAIVFDRGGYLYHGRIQALADGARKGGLQF